jgi:hypothetical protein
MTFLRTTLASGLLASLVLSAHGSAGAKASLESAYGFERTWNAATRLVRVDLGFKITERDEGTGYLLFEYKSPESGSKASAGSMEFLRRGDNLTVVVVQLPEMPQYHEQVMTDRLARKLRAEFGEPPRRPEPAKNRKDAGSPDASSGESVLKNP